LIAAAPIAPVTAPTASIAPTTAPAASIAPVVAPITLVATPASTRIAIPRLLS